MIRFVRNKDGEVFLDNAKSADGRGVWVHKDGDCISKMIKKKTLNAAFRQSVNESLYEELSLMNNKLNSYIGLAQRANAVLYGEDIISEKIRLAKIVLIAQEASDKYKERLKFKFQDKEVFIVEGLLEALHRDNVKAVAIVNEELAKAISNVLR